MVASDAEMAALNPKVHELRLVPAKEEILLFHILGSG
jgi:hypothetical protein